MILKQLNCCGGAHVMRWATPGLALIALSVTGCTSQSVNPSFSTQISVARNDLGRMESQPRHLHRPLVVVGGFLDPGFASGWLRHEFSSLTNDERIISVALGDCVTLDDCGDKIVEATERAFHSDSKSQTREVDVIGYSLGGLASRYAASPVANRKRLTIARLFAISAPLQGALLAKDLPPLHPIQADLRPGSDVLATLDAKSPAYAIYPYVCLGDHVVGESNAGLRGQVAWWVPHAPLADPHDGAFYDPRIVADIARRLRDEPPLATDPPAGLPTASGDRSR
ncbi:MAG TPA: hypothetical protein VIM11_05035 [Tepidisphaeraceae bacterium]|jgi:hypothetical protein